eukprot:5050701-Pleurochrysis_carterae.AAC.1
MPDAANQTRQRGDAECGNDESRGATERVRSFFVRIGEIDLSVFGGKARCGETGGSGSHVCVP